WAPLGRPALGKWRLEREQRRLDLMRIEINLCIHQCSRELFNIVRRTTLGQLISEVFGLVVCEIHRRRAYWREPAVVVQLLLLLDQLSREEVPELNLDTGVPIVYELDAAGKVVKKQMP